MSSSRRPAAGTSRRPLPAGIDALDAPLVEALLREGGLDVEVTGMAVEPFAAGSGFLGDLARLHLAYGDRPGPATVVAKLPPADPGGRAVGRLLGVWHREHRFYAELAPGRGLPVPDCYAAAADPEAERYVLRLEDLGARTDELDQVEGADPDRAERAIDALADLHARWWGDAAEAIAWMPTIAAPAVGTRLQEAVAASLPAFGLRFGDLTTNRSIDALHRFVPRLADWLALGGAGTLAVTHADYRLGNLRFGADTVYVLDWQTAMRAAPATDLAMFTATSLTIEARRRHEGELVDRYLARVRDQGVAVDGGRFRRDYAESFLWWAAMFANNLSAIDTDDERTRTLFDSMIERTHVAIDDHEPEPFP